MHVLDPVCKRYSGNCGSKMFAVGPYRTGYIATHVQSVGMCMVISVPHLEW